MPDTKVWIATIFGIVIVVILLFSIIGGTSSTMIDSARSITDANNCSLGTDNGTYTLQYNYSSKWCEGWNDTAKNRINPYYAALQTDLPLNSLFAETGVIFIAFMAALLIGIIAYVLGVKLKK